MENVTNLIRLVALLVLGFAYLIGLGWLVLGPLVHKSLINIKRDPLHLQEIAQLILMGLFANYAFVLIFQSLRSSLLISSILAAIGFGCFSISLFRSEKVGFSSTTTINRFVGIVFISLLFLGPILFRPLFEWDARSIWFFHAKMIYSEGTFKALLFNNDSSIGFSHLDYPNLVPTLAAQFAFIMGFWNEYLPKISLFFILVPAVIFIFSFERHSFSFIALLITSFFTMNPWIWNGYMDGYLAIYFALSMLLFGRYLDTGKIQDLLSSILCLFLLLYLKNEGALAIIAGACSMIVVSLVRKNSISLKEFFRKNWGELLVFVLVLIPFGMWTALKHQAGLTNDLGIGSSRSFIQIAGRLQDGSLKIILLNFLEQTEVPLLLAGFLFFASLIWKVKISKDVLPVILAIGIYSLGIVIVYLLTPNDLAWQLRTSVNRTMLSVSSNLYVICYFLIRNMEKS